MTTGLLFVNKDGISPLNETNRISNTFGNHHIGNMTNHIRNIGNALFLQLNFIYHRDTLGNILNILFNIIGSYYDGFNLGQPALSVFLKPANGMMRRCKINKWFLSHWQQKMEC
ncbi:MAG: hypothetical protein CSB21_03160 [Deltaproteobacteria bacterium]|nr:MAG: hypothetical protein CSB21_03160 [Deltaproteobacteria bacterium]